MPETKDLLEQFLDLPPERQETLVARLFETLHAPFPWLHRVFKPQPTDTPSVVRTPNVCGGSARLVRTRIPVWTLQRMRQLNFPESKILECFPTLTAGDLVQAWSYVATHKDEIDKEIEENERY